MAMTREQMNVVFHKLAILAGSRAASWRAISECHVKFGRVPTLSEVVTHITGRTS